MKGELEKEKGARILSENDKNHAKFESESSRARSCSFELAFLLPQNQIRHNGYNETLNIVVESFHVAAEHYRIGVVCSPFYELSAATHG